MNTTFLHRSAVIGVAAFVVSFWSAGCGTDPFRLQWFQEPDTALIYSLSRPELNLASAFNFVGRVALEIEAPGSTGQWDILLDHRDGRLVLMPPGAIGILSSAKIAVFPGMTFNDVRKAPRDTADYVSDQPVSLEAGTVYVVQTHRDRDRFGLSCLFYAKLEPIEIDEAAGTLTFVFDSNPLCNDLDLIPPDDD